MRLEREQKWPDGHQHRFTEGGTTDMVQGICGPKEWRIRSKGNGYGVRERETYENGRP